ncbi:MAG: hypothetical protein F4X12_22215 [Acidobacteriia bacterium]|nr:hypothetical protein [Terriglobia bacterium]
MRSQLMLTATLVGTFALVLAGSIQAQQRPNFSGTWELDEDKSKWGNPRMAPSRLTETIDHREPTLIIQRVEVSERGESTQMLKLTTDGIENTNIVGSNSFQSQSTWDGNKLVTKIHDGRGMQLTETRVLSDEGTSQTIEQSIPGRAEPIAQMLMTKIESE